MFAIWQDPMHHRFSKTNKPRSAKGLLKILKTLTDEVKNALKSGEIEPKKRRLARELLVQAYLLMTSEEGFDPVKMKRLTKDLDRMICGETAKTTFPKREFKVFTQIAFGVLKNPICMKVSQLETEFTKISKMPNILDKQATVGQSLRSSYMVDKAPDMEIVFEEVSKE